jgi:tetratricopeptide (TPR) repeat protein
MGYHKVSNEQAFDQLNRHLYYLTQDENNLSLLVKISDLYIELDDLDAAQAYLNKASAINRIACLGHQGLLHLNQGQLTQAQESFTEALSYEDTPELRYNLGLTHFISSDLNNAAKILSPIITDEQYPEAKLLMARVFHGQNDLENAFIIINELLELEPDDAEALGLLTLLHFDMGENELAAQTAQHTLDLDPDNYDAQLIDIMLRLPIQDVDVEEIEYLMHINPNDCRLWFALGSMQMSQGTLDLAAQSFKKAIEIFPEFYDCHIALGWCFLLQDNLEEALNTYQLASELVSELADSWGGLALVYTLKEDFIKAEQFIQESRTRDSECFLAEIAESIYFNATNPQAKGGLVFNNDAVSISEKLAFIIGEIQGSIH